MTTPTETHKSQMPVLSSHDFDFEADSTAVVSEAYKFVIPVPDLGESAEPLVYPEGDGRAGEAIVDYKGRKIGDRGIVFFNKKDQAYQAVPADGTGVIIINEVLPTEAADIDNKVRSLSANLTQLSAQNIKESLHYAYEQFKLGDVYNSTRSYVNQKLTAIKSTNISHATHTSTTIDQAKSEEQPKEYGLKRRNSADIYQAIYVPGAFQLNGPAATVQVFDHGGVVITQNKNVRGIQPEVFIRTYQLADGSPITNINEIATLTLKHLAK